LDAAITALSAWPTRTLLLLASVAVTRKQCNSSK
jgi:hypothetical protein